MKSRIARLFACSLVSFVVPAFLWIAFNLAQFAKHFTCFDQRKSIVKENESDFTCVRAIRSSKSSTFVYIVNARTISTEAHFVFLSSWFNIDFEMDFSVVFVGIYLRWAQRVRRLSIECFQNHRTEMNLFCIHKCVQRRPQTRCGFSSSLHFNLKDDLHFHFGQIKIGLLWIDFTRSLVGCAIFDSTKNQTSTEIQCFHSASKSIKLKCKLANAWAEAERKNC